MATVAPGGKVKLTITAEVDEGWHVYVYQPQVPEGGINLPTLIALAEPNDWNPGNAIPSAAPTAPHGNASLPYYSGTVHWVKEFTVPASAKPGETVISGRVGFQTCSDSGCLPGEGTEFTAAINVPSAAQRSAFLSVSHRHLRAGGNFVFQRHDPAWLAKASVGRVGNLGEVETYIDRLERYAECIDMSLRFQAGSREWLHHFSTVALDDDQVRAALFQAGFEPPEWIDRRWGSARKA